MSDYILEMRNITKEFFGVKALDNVELKVKRGEIHCIVGENGAGKSTLMNILSGTYPYGSYSGDIVYDNEICQFRNIKDSEGKGIVIIHQELALIPGLSVAENLFLGNERQSHGIIDWDRTNEEAKKWLDMVAFKEEATRLVKDIGIGAQQLIEIAKALAKNVKLLILDEPTAALPETEARHLLNLLKELQKQGLTSIIITHKLNEVCYVGDRVTIIRDGCTVGGLSEEEKPFLEDIIVKGMVGREMLHRYPERPDHFVKPEVGFEIREWNTFHPTYAEQQIVKNASLKVHKGEIVGLYGLMGAGRTEMAMSVFGRSYGQKTSGRIFKDGKEIKLRSVAAAIQKKIAYISEDRKNYGLVLPKDIQFNVSLAGISSIADRMGVVDENQDVVVAEDYSKRLNIRSTGIDQRVESLSGGNQQKVVLAKWIFTHPDVLILDEPTRGIDVGAKYEIYCIMNQLAQEGKSVLFISSDLSEILGKSDRIYVMNEGTICAEMDGKTATQESVMQCIVEHNKEEGI